MNKEDFTPDELAAYRKVHASVTARKGGLAWAAAHLDTPEKKAEHASRLAKARRDAKIRGMIVDTQSQ